MSNNDFGAEHESVPLLPSSDSEDIEVQKLRFGPRRCRRGTTIIFATLLVLTSIVWASLHIRYRAAISRDPVKFTYDFLDHYPLFDTHIDLPEWIRAKYHNNASAFDLYSLPDRSGSRPPVHVDILKLRAGRVGGFVWSVYAECPKPGNGSVEARFLDASNAVRDTLEQIDIAKELIGRYSEVFQSANSAQSIRQAMRAGKIASVLGIEGAHQFGNSIAAARQFYNLGVRYATLTHSCHNAFADSAGIAESLVPYHHGLSPLGVELVHEMNRIGMIVDLSHVSQDTARHVLNVTEAPVIWSHSTATGVWNTPRNIPDDILRRIGRGPGKIDAVVQIDFVPDFLGAKGNATIPVVADHIDWIARIAGKAHVGVGSDFDGVGDTAEGLEDASKYPHLFIELRKRGWTANELRGFARDNFLRVFEGVEAVSQRMSGFTRSEAVYTLRTDI